jgi:serine/threonine protein kinase
MANFTGHIHGLFDTMQVEKDLYRGQTDNNSYVFDGPGDYGSSIAGLSRDHFPLSTNFPPSCENPMDASAGITSNELELYPMQSIWPIGLNPAPFDTMKEAVLGSASSSLNGSGYAENFTHDLDGQIDLQHDISAFINIDQPRPRSDPRLCPPVQTCNRCISSSTKTAQNAKVIDGEIVLRLLFKYIPKLTIEDIENIAKDTNYPSDFVFDSYCQYIKNNVLGGVASEQAAMVSQSTQYSQVTGIRKATVTTDLAYGTQVEESTTDNIQTSDMGVHAEGSLSTETVQAVAVDTRNKPHRCYQCNQTFRRQRDLKRHSKIHAPGEFPCRYNGCGKVFNRKDKLNDHLRKWHEDDVLPVKTSTYRRDDSDNDPSSGGPSGPNTYFSVSGPPQNFQSSAGSTSSVSSNHSTSFGYGHTLLKDVLDTGLFVQTQSAAEKQKVLSGWRFIRELGHGGFGSAYEACISHGPDRKDREIIASKIIRIPKGHRNEVIRRARNEINILQLLDHPHIIELAGAYALADRIFINTFPVADCNLTQLLRSQSLPIPTIDKTAILEQLRAIASALAYIHDHLTNVGCAGSYLDLKPDNVLVSYEAKLRSPSQWLICDFGSALISNPPSKMNLKNRAVTSKYSAPEFPKGDIGQKSDIWTFDRVLAEVFTFLHDKTMQDFEIFRSKRVDPKQNWNYSEILPVFIDWLESLSSTRACLACPTLRDHHINLIMEMLRANPKERPSAGDVVSRFQVADDRSTKGLIVAPCVSIEKNLSQEDNVPAPTPDFGEYFSTDQLPPLINGRRYSHELGSPKPIPENIRVAALELLRIYHHIAVSLNEQTLSEASGTIARARSEISTGTPNTEMTFVLSAGGGSVRSKFARRPLSDVQRARTALVRKLQACSDCRKRKVKVTNTFLHTAGQKSTNLF